ncbi:MAG TPA: DUF2142 domain-containing protein [Candidatus Saccharimonadales bacterium]|nr:DUF2142 domain-containing protein [Candidatus Saccharimonadales bacterium]
MKDIFKKISVFRIASMIKTGKLETLFLIIFLVFGIITVFLIPPGWNTDEPDHTYRIYQLSKGNLFSEPVLSPAGNKAYGGEVASGLVNLYKDAGVRDAGASAADKTKKANGLYDAHPNILKYKDDGSKTSINFSGAALYSPVTYALYIPIFKVGTMLHSPFLVILIIARLVGLLAVGLAFFLAIRHIKAGKWIIFVIGLLPVTVIQAASVGADGPLLGVAVLFLMYITNIVYSSKQPTTRNYVILAFLGMLLTFVKLAYAPLTLLILVIPFIKKTPISKRVVITALAATLIAIIPNLIWTTMVSYVDTNSNLQSNFPMQKSFILHEPILYIKTLYYTFFTNEQAPLDALFGNAVWNSVPLPAFFSYLAMTAVVLSVGVKNSREDVMRSMKSRGPIIWKLALLVASSITILIISTALYIYSSTLYQSSIIGLQARYFIPLLPVILLACVGNYFKNQKNVKIIIVCLSVIILLGATFALYHRLYQTLPILLR